MKRVLVQLIVAMSGVLALAGCDGSLAGVVRTESVRDWPSGDGYSLRSFRRHSGAGDPFYTTVELRYRGDWIDDVFVAKGSTDIEVRWIDSRHVRIAHGDCEIVRKLIVGAGISFSFVSEETKEPNQSIQRNASTGSVSNFESPARRG